MSQSMLDEVQVPPAPPLLICPCCKFSFTTELAFTAHCEAMKAMIDAAIAKAKAKKR